MNKTAERIPEYRSGSVLGSCRNLGVICFRRFPKVLAAAVFVVLWVGHGSAGPEPKLQPTSYGYFDFPTCIRYALVHSDIFLRNRIDIQVRSIDLKDAHSELLPTIQLITRYYIARTGPADAGRMNVQLFMTNWNPYLALLKIKSYGILVDMGKTAHMESIADHTAKAGKLFYGISLLEKAIRANKTMLALERNKLDSARSRNEMGTVDDLSLRSWHNAVKSRRLRLKGLEFERDKSIGQLKRLIGYHPDYHLPLDTRDAINQILRGFNGASVTFADVQGSNLQLKLMAKQEQVESNSVTGAYVALLPRPVVLFEDIQNQVDRRSGFNFALGLDYTLWDGFKRVRDIKRQKLRLRRVEVKRKELSEEMYVAFKDLRNSLSIAGETEAFSREQATIAELSEEKAFLAYKAGDLPYEEYMNRRIDTVEAQLEAVKSAQDRVVSLIDLATMAGGLNKYNAGIRY
ncbi:MAG: TolC family protein [Desulfomonilaceae bacterium]|nr:TolC family protein [Desulfomonilaceae bacterium]